MMGQIAKTYIETVSTAARVVSNRDIVERGRLKFPNRIDQRIQEAEGWQPGLQACVIE